MSVTDSIPMFFHLLQMSSADVMLWGLQSWQSLLQGSLGNLSACTRYSLPCMRASFAFDKSTIAGHFAWIVALSRLLCNMPTISRIMDAFWGQEVGPYVQRAQLAAWSRKIIYACLIASPGHLCCNTVYCKLSNTEGLSHED